MNLDYISKKEKDDLIKEIKDQIKVKDGVSPKLDTIVQEVLFKLQGTSTNLGDIQGVGFLVDRLRAGGYRGGGDTVVAGSNITITPNANGNKVIAAAGTSVGPGNINEIAYFNTTTTIASLPVLTYPSLTEFSYLKGVTSPLQTQINTKGSGTVTSVSVVTANGISGSVATATSTPAITLTLGAITPTSINGNIFTTGSSTYTGTAGQTYTFPTTSATIARTDASNTFTGHQTIEGVTSTGATGTGKFVFDTAPQISTIELGNASDTTLSRVSAGVIAVEGKTVATTLPYGARAYQSAAGQTITASSFQTVTLDVESWDLSNEFTANTYTATTAGKYVVQGKLYMVSMNAGKRLSIAIVVNGTRVAEFDNFSTYAGDNSGQICDIINLAVNDAVTLQVFQGDTGSKSLDNSSLSTNFSIQRIY